MKVLYILGRGRSGSTVLANVLGEIPGFFSAGELRFLWDPVVVQRSQCGCGMPIAECPVWSKVLDRLADVDVDRVATWQRDIVRESNIFKLIWGRGNREWPALDGYARVTGRLYRAIEEVTGCSVIVDSSKRPSYAAFINRLEGFDPYFVHLARDPRASAYSWQSRRHASIRGAEVHRRNALDSTVRWDLLNMGSEVLLRRVARTRQTHLRYEDFVDAPRTTVRGICDLLGEPALGLPFVDESTVELGINHTIAGNPSRFKTGSIVVRDTSEWRTEQDAVSRWIATLVALPFLHHYGYPVRRMATPPY